MAQSRISEARPAANAPGVRAVTLDNGLRILVQEVHTAPLVSVWCWYQVGSKDERQGLTGVSHWVEHMNFKGTRNIPKEEMKGLIERAGGSWNGYTWIDQTTYLETASRDALEQMLFLESERMANCLYDPAEVQSERTVIISELQGGENDPEQLLDVEVTAAAFKAHPYHHPTIGWLADLRQMTRDDLYGYYRRFYVPDNATLVIVGDVETDAAVGLVRKHFGWIPPGDSLQRTHTAEPEQLGERRVVVAKDGTTAYLKVAFHAPAVTDPDFYPMLVLDAVLTGAKGINLWTNFRSTPPQSSSRLYRALVDRGLASAVGGALLPTQHPFLFAVSATVREGVGLAAVEGALLAELERVKAEPIGDRELDKGRNQLKARYVFDGDSVTNIAHQLGYFATIDSYETYLRFPERLATVTVDDVQRVARRYLRPSNRTIGWFDPGSASGPPGPVESGGASSGPISPRSAPRVALHHPERIDRRGAVAGRPASTGLAPSRTVLPNGLVVVAQYSTTAPSAAILLTVRAGGLRETDETAGQAFFVSKLLERGTAARSAAEIAELLDYRGVSLAITSNRHVVSVSAMVLEEDFSEMLGVLGDLVMRPSFPAEEVERRRGEIVTMIRQDDDSTQARAVQALVELLYPIGHPYRRPIKGFEATIKGLTRGALASFHARYFRPDETTLVVAGAVVPARVVECAAEVFGGWPGRSEPLPFEVPAVEAWRGGSPRRTTIPMMNKVQADVAYGLVGIRRDDPRYFPTVVMNNVLGQFGLGGRLGDNIRDRQGMAYYVFSQLDPNVGPGPFMIRAGVNPDNVDRALAAIDEEVRRMLAEGVTERELAEAKRFMIGSLPRNLETNAGIAAFLQNAEYFGLGLDYDRRLPERIEAVTLEETAAAARALLRPDEAAVAVAGPIKDSPQ